MTIASTYPSTVGKHQITGILGQGGMGMILSARDPDLDREVAIKLVDPRLLDTADSRARFIREARALAKLNEPHVVQVYEFQPDGSQPYLVMERLRGRDLRAIVQKEGPLSLERVIDCAWQVLRGLAAAHAAGVVHRDIKPTNLMLVEGGIYKILDFGLAQADDERDLTAAGEVVGTLRYMPPERLRGIEPGPPGDLWSLGVTLVELATGHRPDCNRTHPISLPGAGPGLASWLTGLTANDPGQRYATAAEALHALALAVPEPKAPASSLPPPITASEAPTATSPQGPFSDQGRSTIGFGTGITQTIRPTPMGERSSRLIIQHPRIPFVVKIVIAIWIISSAATIFTGWAISSLASNTQMARLRQELIGIAGDASLLIDPQAHARLAASPDAKSPDLAIMRAALQRLRNLHPDIRNIYTMGKLPETDSTGIVVFVCDASEAHDENANGLIDDDEKQAEPGKPYPAKDSPSLLAGFETAGADADVSKDQWGEWISGYAPIRDASGRSVGLVGIDLPATHIAALRSAFIRSCTALLALTLLAFLAAGYLVAMRLRRPIAELHRGMLALANGDLDVSVKVRSYDEFQALSDAFAKMRDELKRAAAIRKAFDAFVTRALTGSASMTVAAPGARLACQLSLGMDTGNPLSQRLASAMPRLFSLAQDQGGHPEQVDAGGVQIVFPAANDQDLPQERAVRVALILLAELEHRSGSLDLAIGIAVGSDPTKTGNTAMAMARIGAARGLDLLITPDAFAPIRPGFFADRLVGLPRVGEVFVIKGAVSG